MRDLYNHEPNHLLGSSSTGTLRMDEDNLGLRYENDLPDTTLGRVEQTNADKWTTDLVSVRFIARGGGVLVDTAALRKLVQA